MLWFTSDQHFNHTKILELSKRPFGSVGEMNETLIDNWNAAVEHTDQVYVLGDFAFWYTGAQSLEDIFSRLAGEKHLVVGNHDEQNRRVLKLPWVSQSSLVTVRYGETRFIACHFPLERWWHQERGTLHVHGHCHGGLRRHLPHRFDVGVDPCQYYPVSAKWLEDTAAWQAFTPSDYYV